MNKEEFENNFMCQPIRNGFEDYKLSELDKMLREVLKYAVPGDKPFIKALAFEIDNRRRKY